MDHFPPVQEKSSTFELVLGDPAKGTYEVYRGPDDISTLYVNGQIVIE